MTDTIKFSEAKRALLAKYLSEERLQGSKKATSSITKPAVARVGGPHECIVPIQRNGHKRPFFFLHGDWTGNAYFCFPLAHHQGAEQPFYSLEPYSFAGLSVLPSLETMAAAHIKSMRTIQPEGPYLLGGFCNGALTAYEMARQLQAAGQQVDLQILIDIIPARLSKVCYAIRLIGKLLGLNEEKQLDWFLRLQHAARYLLDKHSEDFEHIKKTDPRIDSFFPPIETLRKEYPAMFTWATSCYRPTFYDGKITLFWDEEEPGRRAWWNSWARGKDKEVEVHIIAGTHTTCKTEHAMAQQLRECLDKVV